MYLDNTPLIYSTFQRCWHCFCAFVVSQRKHYDVTAIHTKATTAISQSGQMKGACYTELMQPKTLPPLAHNPAQSVSANLNVEVCKGAKRAHTSSKSQQPRYLQLAKTTQSASSSSVQQRQTAQ